MAEKGREIKEKTEELIDRRKVGGREMEFEGERERG